MERSRSKWYIVAGIVILAVILIMVFKPGKKQTGTAAAAAAPPAPPVPVSVATAQTSSLTRTIQVIGQLQSDREVTLTSKIPGKLVQMLVDTGNHVSAGQMVARLDDSDAINGVQQAQAALALARAHYDQARSGVGMKDTQTAQAITSAKANLQAAKERLAQAVNTAKIGDTQAEVGVQQAKANLASAQQNLKLTIAGARQQQREEASLEVDQAQANYDQAQDNYNRMESLYKAGAVPQQTWQSAKYAMQAAQAALGSAKQQSSLVEAGNLPEQVAIAQQSVNQAKAAYDLAVAQLAKRAYNQQDVQAAQAAVRQLQSQLDIAEAGKAQYTLTRQDVEAFAAQLQQAQAQLDAAKLQLAETRICTPVSGIIDTRPATVGSSITATTVLMTVAPTHGLYFEADVPEASIASVRVGDPVRTTVDALPGQVFTGHVSEIIPIAEAATKLYRVHISVPDDTGVLPMNGFARGTIAISQVRGVIIPKDALASSVGDFYVYTISDGHAHRTPVTLGYTDDTRAQVLTGLKPGETYAVVGISSLTDGAKVEVRPDPRIGTSA